jgi:hypothetical protein
VHTIKNASPPSQTSGKSEGKISESTITTNAI